MFCVDLDEVMEVFYVDLYNGYLDVDIYQNTANLVCV